MGAGRGSPGTAWKMRLTPSRAERDKSGKDEHANSFALEPPANDATGLPIARHGAQNQHTTRNPWNQHQQGHKNSE